MKRVLYSNYGEPANVLEVIEEDVAAPGVGEVSIAVEAAPAHIADLKNIRGEPYFRFPLPRTPGYEGIGRIVAVGPEVGSRKVGDRVFLPVSCGAWREQLVAKAADLVPAPEGDAIQLSLLPINPPTSYLMLEDFGQHLKPGDWIIQNAANSSCGVYLVRLARMRGIRTVNVVRRDSVFPLLRDAGADVVVVDGPDLAARVATETGGAAITLGIDAVGGPATERIASCLVDGGTVLNYGMLTGEPCHIMPTTLFQRDIRLLGFWTRRQNAKRTPAEVSAVYTKLAAMVAGGQLSAQIAGVFPFSRAKEACALAARVGDERPGKVILVPG